MKIKTVTPLPLSTSLPLYHFQVDYMDENEEYFQRQASHRQSRRRFRKINQKGERQTIIDTVDPYPSGKPPIARGYHTVSCRARCSSVYPGCGRSLRRLSVALVLFSCRASSSEPAAQSCLRSWLKICAPSLLC